MNLYLFHHCFLLISQMFTWLFCHMYYCCWCCNYRFVSHINKSPSYTIILNPSDTAYKSFQSNSFIPKRPDTNKILTISPLHLAFLSQLYISLFYLTFTSRFSTSPLYPTLSSSKVINLFFLSMKYFRKTRGVDDIENISLQSHLLISNTQYLIPWLLIPNPFNTNRLSFLSSNINNLTFQSHLPIYHFYLIRKTRGVDDMSNSFLAGFAAGMVRGLQTRSPKIIMYTGTYIAVLVQYSTFFLPYLVWLLLLIWY